MTFDLDYEYKGMLYCVKVNCFHHDGWCIESIEKYLPNNHRTASLNGKELENMVDMLEYDNTFIDMVSGLQDEYRHERYY